MIPEQVPCTAAGNETPGIRPGQVWGPTPRPPIGRTWSELMGLALDQARAGSAAGEVPVGAIVVAPDGRVIGAAHNAPCRDNDPSAHAEVIALRRAGRRIGNHRLERCVLVATLEPCLMCVGAMVHARVAGVVYGAADDKAGAVMSCLHGPELPFLNHRVWHMGGVRGVECARLLEAFFAECRSRRL